MESPEKYFYEKAIQGLEFHTSRFNTWMNLYTIFVGAFFLAYYNVNTDEHFIRILIAVLGYFASVFWFGSLLGYYSWLISWTEIVTFHEGMIPEIVKNNKLRVYSLVSDSYLRKTGFSTQKITKIFIFFVMLAWLCVFGYELYNLSPNSCHAYCLAFFIPFLLFVLTYIIYLLIKKKILSNLNSHYVLRKRNKKYEIENPQIKMD